MLTWFQAGILFACFLEEHGHSLTTLCKPQFPSPKEEEEFWIGADWESFDGFRFAY